MPRENIHYFILIEESLISKVNGSMIDSLRLPLSGETEALVSLANCYCMVRKSLHNPFTTCISTSCNFIQSGCMQKIGD
jgi:hypothetical protein